MGGVDLKYVWTEVRKRVFIKLPFSLPLAEAMEAVVPITLDEDTFVCGLPPQKFQLSGLLQVSHISKQELLEAELDTRIEALTLALAEELRYLPSPSDGPAPTDRRWSLN
jgi:hypothetical protein